MENLTEGISGPLVGWVQFCGLAPGLFGKRVLCLLGCPVAQITPLFGSLALLGAFIELLGDGFEPFPFENIGTIDPGCAEPVLDGDDLSDLLHHFSFIFAATTKRDSNPITDLDRIKIIGHLGWLGHISQ